jgi:hypothetical protein
VLRRYLDDLSAGDPVALIATAVIAGVLLVVLLLWFKIARDKRRHDREWEEQRRRRGY